MALGNFLSQPAIWVHNGCGEDATQAENALAKGLADLENTPNHKKPAVIVGASRDGKSVVGTSRSGSDGCCAERGGANQLGGDPKTVTFSKPIRPRTGQEIPVCENCQQKFDKDQFPEGTKFEEKK